MAFIGNTPTQQAFTAAVDVFSGNGSTTAFTLSRPVASVAQVEAVIENVQQSPVDAYTVSGNTITFTSAPPSGSSNIYVRYTSPITQVISPTDGSVGTSKLVDGAVTTAKLADASVTSAKAETLMKPLGVGQTWTDVSASRAWGTTYTNTTGRPIFISVFSSSVASAAVWTITVGGAIANQTYAAAACQLGVAIVPAGSTYVVSGANGSSVVWFELR